MLKDRYYLEASQHIKAIPPSTPLHRKASRHRYSFSTRCFKEQLEIWDSIWKNADDFWLRAHAFFFLERNLKNEQELKEMWPVVVKWQDDIDDWGLCDALAKIYTNILTVLPGKVYTQLKKWNRDGNLWKRRQSVVSLLYYSRTKKKHLSFDKIVRLITPLLSDKEYYVQKGVGWALREMHAVYPDKSLMFLQKNIRKISSTAFTIAIEKLNSTQKGNLKALRKNEH
jgi:3-methyladenine DNA glycosylase AlkD